MRKTLSIVLAVLLLAAMTVPAFGNSEPETTQAPAELSEINKKLADILVDKVTIPEDSAESFELDWLIFTLSLPEIGKRDALPEGEYLAYVQECYNNVENLTLTALCRWLLALRSLQSPRDKSNDLKWDIQKILLERFKDWDLAAETSTNALATAVYVMEMHDINPKPVQDILVASSRGFAGWNYALAVDENDPFTKDADVDTTAMVLAALYPREYGISDRKTATEGGESWMISQQLPSGGWASFGNPSAESTAQVIIAMSALRHDQKHTASSESLTPLESLEDFRLESGEIGWDGVANTVAGEQVLRANAAYLRFLNTQTSIYTIKQIAEEPKDHMLIKTLAICGTVAVLGGVAFFAWRKKKD
ncbi:MAG: terpene cyclase/mutase family protein, partial [Oscillospiraceae bacterium]|nr:terpene cyclase/mutase family protein [Oscillospiraceae bacterium]